MGQAAMRILFVATLSSPLAARWVGQLAGTEWDVHVFGTEDAVHPLFCAENITVHVTRPVNNPGHCSVRRYRDLWPWVMRGRTRLRRNLPWLARLLTREPADHLRKLIRQLRPDIVHSLMMQSPGYITFDALQSLRPEARPKWLYSAWGSDIYLFRHFPEQRQRIEQILPGIDYLMVDNQRDILLAQEHGFRGVALGVFPTGGGYPLAQMRRYVQAPPSQRRIIALKGYQAEHGGQALTALEGVKRCGSRLEGYRIVIHSAIGTYASAHFERVQQAAQEVSRLCNVPVEFLPFSPPEDVWRLFGQARIALAISTSDGTPNAMLEAMCVGAFPIQSNTGGLEQWIDSGKNGYLVPFDDAAAIADAVAHTLEDDALVDTAADVNYALTDERLDYDFVRRRTLEAYAGVFAARGGPGEQNRG